MMPFDWSTILISFIAGVMAAGAFIHLRRRSIPTIRRKIVENMEDGILVFDTDGKAIDINQSAENILGWKINQIKGQTMEELFSQKSDLSAFLKPDIINGQFFLQVVDVTRTYDVRVAPLTDETGNLVGEMVSFRDISRLKAIEDELRHLSTIDPLTNLYNRRYFFKVIKTEIARARRYGSTLSIIMMDLNSFKLINDNYGHLAGDKILKDVSSAIQRIVRVSDYAVRYGGDEFLILLPQTDCDGAKDLSGRLALEIGKIKVSSTTDVAVSYGFTNLQEEDDEDGVTLVARADQLMYQNKNQKKAVE